jgi:enoyl-CoA hydratase
VLTNSIITIIVLDDDHNSDGRTDDAGAGENMSESAVVEGRVRSERHGHILKIVIDNPAKKNAFVPAMMAQLSVAMTELDRDPALWVGVLCAEGDNFTAGLDMPKFFGPTATPAQIPDDHIDPFGMRNQCRKPVITAVQGICFTVGIEMALAGDIVVAAEGSRFCQMEAKRGIAPLGGAHFRFLTRAGWGNAMYHLLLCDEFGAEEAYRIGLVQEVTPAGQQVERAMEIARTIAANAPLGIQVTKEAGRKFIEAGERAAIDVVPTIRQRVMGTADAAEGIASFVERRAAVFQGR